MDFIFLELGGNSMITQNELGNENAVIVFV
jgi:hypothetical protein